MTLAIARLHWTFGFTEGFRFVVGILGGDLRGTFFGLVSNLGGGGNKPLDLIFLTKMVDRKTGEVKFSCVFLPERGLVGCF